MILLDIAIIAVMVVSFFVGILRGFVREVLSVASWAVAAFAAYKYSPQVSQLLEQYIPFDSTIRLIAAFVIILIGVIILASILSSVIAAAFESFGIKNLDRSLGGVFGAIRGGLLIGVFILLAGYTSFTNEAWWQESKLLDYFKPIAQVLHDLMPENVLKNDQIKDLPNSSPSNLDS